MTQVSDTFKTFVLIFSILSFIHYLYLINHLFLFTITTQVMEKFE